MIFLFFSSSLAHLEPKLELFEVLEFGSWCHWRWWWFVARLSPKLQTVVTWVLDELERNQKKENHLKTISKMMGTLVQVQLYTFSSRMALYRPRWRGRLHTLKQANFGVCSHFFSVSPQTTRNCVVGFLKKILQHPFAPTLPRRACTRVSPFWKSLNSLCKSGSRPQKSPKKAQKTDHSIAIYSNFWIGMVYFGYHLVKAHVQTVQNMYGKGG